MPTRKKHVKVDKDLGIEGTEKIHRGMDSSSQRHPGEKHKGDKCHSVKSAMKKHGGKAWVGGVAMRHLDEDLRSSVRKKQRKRIKDRSV